MPCPRKAEIVSVTFWSLHPTGKRLLPFSAKKLHDNEYLMIAARIVIAKTDAQGFLIIHTYLSITSKCDKD